MIRTNFFSTLLVSVLAVSSTGCIKKVLLNGQIASTRIGAGAVDSIDDYELARAAASAGMLQFEGMHRLAPDNEDALYLLMKGWAGYGYAFAMDDYEAAVIADDEALTTYHRKRARQALARILPCAHRARRNPFGRRHENHREAHQDPARAPRGA
jgi:hypothetical protein